MTEIEQQIYDDLSTAGWNLFTDTLSKVEVAQHLARKGYRRPEIGSQLSQTTPLSMERYCTGGYSSDCSAAYEVKLSREATLQEFLTLIFQTFPDEWGMVTDRRFGNVLIEYDNHSIMQCNIPDLDFVIEPIIVARGGYSRMDYIITKKKIEPEQKEVPNEWNLSRFAF